MKLTAGNALVHFKNTDGPKGFLWKFAVFYLSTMGALQIVGMIVNWPVYEIYAELFTGGFSADEMNERLRPYELRNALWTLVSLPLWGLVWVVLEGAMQRRYLHGEGFRLRLGADEGRLAVVGLIWFGLIIAAYIGLVIVMIVVMLFGIFFATTSPVLSIFLGAMIGLAFLGVLLYFVTRYSAASALTVRDQQIKFFQSWAVTRGRWRGMFNAFIILSVLAILLIVMIYGVGFIVGYSQIEPLLRGGSPDTDAIIAALTSPRVYVPLGLLMGLYLLASSVIWYIWTGVGALAARTDPEWAGQIGIAAEFD